MKVIRKAAVTEPNSETKISLPRTYVEITETDSGTKYALIRVAVDGSKTTKVYHQKDFDIDSQDYREMNEYLDKLEDWEKRMPDYISDSELKRIATLQESNEALSAEDQRRLNSDLTHENGVYFDKIYVAWINEGMALNTEYIKLVWKLNLFCMFEGVSNLTDPRVREYMRRYWEDEGTGVNNDLLSKTFFQSLYGTMTNDLMSISTNKLEREGYTNNAFAKTARGSKITFEDYEKYKIKINTSARKLLDVAAAFLGDGNYYGKDNVNATVEIPLKAYGEACGKNLTPEKKDTEEEQVIEDKRVDNSLKDFKKQIRKDLTSLSNTTWTGEETSGRNKGDYEHLRIISSHSIKNGIIRINFDPDAARYLNNAYLMQYPSALLRLDNRNNTAYVIGRRIARHNSIDNNWTMGTASTLSVKKLLEAASDIPSYEKLEDRGQRNWREKIKGKLESALDANIDVGYLKTWIYRDPKTKDTYTASSSKSMTWSQYYRLMVDFTFQDEDYLTSFHNERLQKKAEKKKERESKERTGEKRGTDGGKARNKRGGT